MANDNGKTVGVSNDKGQIIQVPVVTLQDSTVSQVYTFVKANHDYFEDHSLDWSVEEIISHGIREIKRLVKAAKERASNKAAGDMIKELGFTPEQAAAFIKQALAAKAQAEANAQTKEAKK